MEAKSFSTDTIVKCWQDTLTKTNIHNCHNTLEEGLAERLEHCLELTPNDDTYLRILIKDLLLKIGTDKTSKQRMRITISSSQGE